MTATVPRAEPPVGDRTILLTGASGYVGGRLLPRLQSMGRNVRLLVRSPESLRDRIPSPAQVVIGDVLDLDSLERALENVDTAYYLVHAMSSGADFETKERMGALNFAAAATARGVRRIIYLGGLGQEGDSNSAHMRSRLEVGRILRQSGVPTIELRASVVIGSGSISFEMIRALVERLPAMVTPRWVRVVAQPIAIEDLVSYLIGALDLPEETRVVEIGGADRVSYGELMREYARQRGLRRLMLPVPFLTPRLSSLWLRLVTPLYARVGRALIDSIKVPSVVRDPSGMQLFPIRPVGMREAVAAALRDEEREFAATRWSDALPSAGAPARAAWRGRYGNRILDVRTRTVSVPPERAFEPIAWIGGDRGWYAHDWMWRLRGAADRLVGGVGMRRTCAVGAPRVGAALDFWRVEVHEPGRRLRLAAEMKLPGRAWLEFEAEPHPEGALIRQTAVFDPRGLRGLLYWHLLDPFHRPIFNGMLAGIARAAEATLQVDSESRTRRSSGTVTK